MPWRATSRTSVRRTALMVVTRLVDGAKIKQAKASGAITSGNKKERPAAAPEKQCSKGGDYHDVRRKRPGRLGDGAGRRPQLDFAGQFLDRGVRGRRWGNRSDSTASMVSKIGRIYQVIGRAYQALEWAGSMSEGPGCSDAETGTA